MPDKKGKTEVEPDGKTEKQKRFETLEAEVATLKKEKEEREKEKAEEERAAQEAKEELEKETGEWDDIVP